MKKILSFVLIVLLFSTIVLAKEVQLSTAKKSNPFVDVKFKLDGYNISKAKGIVIWDGGVGDTKTTAILTGTGYKDAYAYKPYANYIFDAIITRIDNTDQSKYTYHSQVEVFTINGRVFMTMMG